MRNGGRRALAAVAMLTAGLVAPAGADTPDPSPWPAGPTVDPGIDATAHSLRIAGPDRTQTSLSSALLLRGDGGYPFSTSDRTSGPEATLATANQWWGLGTCPFAVIITAGDTAADSLAAASLSDPTDGSTEPQLVRSASADDFLDPVGATSRVDTDSAPIVVTASTRQGATSLSHSARTAVADLAQGGCDTVDAAIIVGGTGAVPAAVDQQLIGLGVDEVFRVAGEDRFGTAARIARALGTGVAVGPGTRCADSDVTDGDARMGFHGNAAPELRTSATSCRVLGRTVVLTDGITGADALAAGWWTSTWQVPVLLVDGEGRVPPATLSALNSLVIDNIVVLGGQARVPDQTVSYVRQVTGADAHRIAGPDRYSTSVQMAQVFGGWFPTGDGTDHDGSMICLASSSGTGSGSIGWPDALGAGPWCAAAGGLASARPAPVRGLSPVSGPVPRTSRGLEPSHDAVPVLLTPAGSAQLATPVAALLASVFDPSDTWCSSLQTAQTCLDPGFAVAFGGGAVLVDDAVHAAARAVSGQTYATLEDQAPFSQPGFWTDLDLRPVYGEGGATESVTAGRACVDRGALTGVRWLSAYADVTTATFLSEYDVFGAERYVTDRDGVLRTPGESAPVCLRVPATSTGLVNALGTSVSGHTTTIGEYPVAPERRLLLSADIEQEGAELTDGADTLGDRSDGSESRVVFSDAGISGPIATFRTQPAGVTDTTIDLTITRGAETAVPDRFEATISVTTALGTVLAVARGDARYVQGTWALRGSTGLTGGTWGATNGWGGFRADLLTGDEGTLDDVLTWRFDAVLAPAEP